MIRILKYIILAIFVLALSACHKADTNEVKPVLSFQAQARDIETAMKSGAGEGVVKTDQTRLETMPFGVSGVWNDTEESVGGNQVFLSEREKVTYNGTKWEYDHLQYWKLNKFYRFRASHPYSGPSFELKSSSADNFVIEYYINPGTDDLLVGFKAVEATVDNIKQPVKLDFQHALCGLQFKIALKNVSEIADDDKDTITEFHIEGLISTGTLIYTYDPSDVRIPVLNWNATYYSTDSFFSWSGAKEFPKYNDSKTNAVDIFDGTDNMVFCIPQTCSSTPEKPTTIHFKTLGGDDAVNSATLPTLKWEDGKIYIYTLLVNKSDLEIKVSIKDWKEIQSSEDIYL